MSHLEAHNIQVMSHTVEMRYNPESSSTEVWRLGGIAAQAVASALDDAASINASVLLPEHILAGVLRGGRHLLSYINPDYTLTPDNVYQEFKGRHKPLGKHSAAAKSISLSPETLNIFEHSISEARNLNAPYVYLEHLLLGLCKTKHPVRELIASHGFNAVRIKDALKQRKREELLRFSKSEKKPEYDDYQLTGRVFTGQEAQYKILRFVKIGGMGAVYAALRYPKSVATIPEKITDALQHLPLHIYPACFKYLKPEVIAHYKGKFIDEIKLMEGLIHPNIIRTFGSGETKEGRLFYSMEWVEGCNLEERITQSRGLTVEESLLIMEQACLALHYAHDKGVYHLDVKPNNIMLLQSNGKTAQVKLIDFGLAKVAAEAGMTTTLTRVGGTPYYCAPEVYSYEASPKSDVFSLGITLYYMLTGVMPVSGASYERAKLNQRTKLPPIPPIGNNRPDLPPEIDRVIAKAHQRDPRSRHRTALEFLADYKRALGLGETITVAPAAAPGPERAPVEARESGPVGESGTAPAVAHAETRLLLEGEAYDREVISTRDARARQMIAAALLTALAGRNVERRERARAAFKEFGYFAEAAEDLRTAQDADERSSAARALGLAGDRAATPHLVGALEDSAIEVRRAAVESLAALCDPAAVEALEALLRRERKSKPKVNRKLVEHAVQVCREGVAEPPAPTQPEAPLASGPGDVSAARARRRKRAAEWARLDIGGPVVPSPAAAGPPVFEASTGEAAVPSETWAPETPAAEVAGKTGRAAESDVYSSVPASIERRLASREPAERAAAVAELTHLNTDEAFQQICAAFDDRASDVRSAAARALYGVQGDRAESFTRALREAPPDRRRNIGAAIAASGLASDAILQLTGETREKTYEAFSLLFLMAKAGEVMPLVRAIETHPNNEVRLAVVKLLALSGQGEILPAFRRLAVRGSLPTEVRSAVMEAIYQISSQL